MVMDLVNQDLDMLFSKNNIVNTEIGGYFELELGVQYDNIKNYIALNSARNALRYIIRAYNIKEIYIPYYTCPVIFDALKKENCTINFYHINEEFMPENNFKSNCFILYTNYFGLNDDNIKKISKIYENLIVDNAQSFYMKNYGIAGFNSIRKFFGVSDGSLVYINKRFDMNLPRAKSYHKFMHLLKRIDLSAQEGYLDFCKNEENFDNEDIQRMSFLTEKLFNSINIVTAKHRRKSNYIYLQKNLPNTEDIFSKNIENLNPIIYPYFCKNADKLKEHLINNKIYIAKYWTDLNANTLNSFEKYLVNNLLAIPVDQRYNSVDMQNIIKIIKENIEE